MKNFNCIRELRRVIPQGTLPCMVRLRGLKFENYKGVGGLGIDFTERLTVLIGENGIGKSSILEAAALPTEVFSALGRNDSSSRSRVDHALGGEEAFSRKACQETVPIRLSFELDQGGFLLEWQLQPGRFDGSWAVELRLPPVSARLASNDVFDHERRARFIDHLSHYRLAATYFRFDAAHLAADSAAPTETPRLSTTGEGLPSVLNWLASNDRGALDRIETMLKAIVPNVTGIRTVPTKVAHHDEVRFSTGTNEALVPLQRTVGGHRLMLSTTQATRPLVAAEMSEGTLLALAVLSAVSLPGDTTLLLIDDLDRGLHPGAQGAMMACLRQLLERIDSLQVICTTHSPYLLDHVSEPEVRVLSRRGGAVEAKRLQSHPDWVRLGASMGLGEFWSTVGEAWVGA